MKELPGQKIVTTHSPYFVQHVPFRDLRIVRLTQNGTEVSWLPPSFSVHTPNAPTLMEVVTSSAGMLVYDRATETLTVRGKLEDGVYRRLLTCYGEHPDRASVHGALRRLRDMSLLHMSDEELRALETYARRIRGFARRWLIVEGRAEYILVHALARSLRYDLDERGVAEHSVAGRVRWRRRWNVDAIKARDFAVYEEELRRSNARARVVAPLEPLCERKCQLLVPSSQ